jgi:hypothetical protein
MVTPRTHCQSTYMHMHLRTHTHTQQLSLNPSSSKMGARPTKQLQNKPQDTKETDVRNFLSTYLFNEVQYFSLSLVFCGAFFIYYLFVHVQDLFAHCVLFLNEFFYIGSIFTVEKTERDTSQCPAK